MKNLKKMKLVPIDYECSTETKPSNLLDEEINKIYKTTHKEDIKARLYTSALKKYLFKTHKYKNLNKVLEKQKKDSLSFKTTEDNFSNRNDNNSGLLDFEPTLTSTPIRKQKTSKIFEKSIINTMLKPRKKKLLAKKKLKHYFENLSESEKSNSKDLTWINY